MFPQSISLATTAQSSLSASNADAEIRRPRPLVHEGRGETNGLLEREDRPLILRNVATHGGVTLENAMVLKDALVRRQEPIAIRTEDGPVTLCKGASLEGSICTERGHIELDHCMIAGDVTSERGDVGLGYGVHIDGKLTLQALGLRVGARSSVKEIVMRLRHSAPSGAQQELTLGDGTELDVLHVEGSALRLDLGRDAYIRLAQLDTLGRTIERRHLRGPLQCTIGAPRPTTSASGDARGLAGGSPVLARSPSKPATAPVYTYDVEVISDGED